eukprot:PhM_4_TR17047/c0_g1_i1/m.8496
MRRRYMIGWSRATFVLMWMAAGRGGSHGGGGFSGSSCCSGGGSTPLLWSTSSVVNSASPTGSSFDVSSSVALVGLTSLWEKRSARGCGLNASFGRTVQKAKSRYTLGLRVSGLGTYRCSVNGLSRKTWHGMYPRSQLCSIATIDALMSSRDKQHSNLSDLHCSSLSCARTATRRSALKNSELISCGSNGSYSRQSSTKAGWSDDGDDDCGSSSFVASIWICLIRTGMKYSMSSNVAFLGRGKMSGRHARHARRCRAQSSRGVSGFESSCPSSAQIRGGTCSSDRAGNVYCMIHSLKNQDLKNFRQM